MFDFDDFDLLIVPSNISVSGEEERYEIVDKQDSVIQGRLVSQRFTVHLLEAADSRYQISYITGLLPTTTSDAVISTTVGGDTVGSL